MKERKKQIRNLRKRIKEKKKNDKGETEQENERTWFIRESKKEEVD